MPIDRKARVRTTNELDIQKMNDFLRLGGGNSFGPQRTIKIARVSADECGWHLMDHPISEDPNY